MEHEEHRVPPNGSSAYGEIPVPEWLPQAQKIVAESRGSSDELRDELISYLETHARAENELGVDRIYAGEYLALKAEPRLRAAYERARATHENSEPPGRS